jgi:hypothetical protein
MQPRFELIALIVYSKAAAWNQFPGPGKALQPHRIVGAF